MKGKECGRKRQWNAIRFPCSCLKELRRITKKTSRKISVLAEKQTGYLPIKVRSSTRLARSCLFKHWEVQSPVQNGTLYWEPKPVFSSVLNCATGQEGLSSPQWNSSSTLTDSFPFSSQLPTQLSLYWLRTRGRPRTHAQTGTGVLVPRNAIPSAMVHPEYTVQIKSIPKRQIFNFKHGSFTLTS